MQIHEYIIQNRATPTVALNFFNPIVGRAATFSCDSRREKYDTRRFSHSLSPLLHANPIESIYARSTMRGSLPGSGDWPQLSRPVPGGSPATLWIWGGVVFFGGRGVGWTSLQWSKSGCRRWSRCVSLNVRNIHLSHRSLGTPVSKTTLLQKFVL